MTIFKNLRSNKTAQEKTRTSNLITSGLKGIGNLTGLRKKSNVTAETKQQAVNASKSLESLKTPAKAKFVSFVANRLLDNQIASQINNNLNIHNTVYQQQAGEANNPRLQFREKLGELIGESISGKLSTNDTKKAQQILLNQNQGTLKKLVNDANKIFTNPSLTKSDSHKLTMDTLEMAGLVKREVKDNKPTYTLKKPNEVDGTVKSAQALYADQAKDKMPTSNRLEYGNKAEAERKNAAATKIQAVARGFNKKNELKSVEKEKQINSKNALGSKDRAEQRATTEIKNLFIELPNSEVATEPFISKHEKEKENIKWLSILENQFPETKKQFTKEELDKATASEASTRSEKASDDDKTVVTSNRSQKNQRVEI